MAEKICASYGCTNTFEQHSRIKYCHHHRFIESPVKTAEAAAVRAAVNAVRAARMAMYDAEMARREVQKNAEKPKSAKHLRLRAILDNKWSA